MGDQPGRTFFLEPRSTFHRRYEALRAFFVDEQPPAEIAARFGYKPAAFKVMISRFRAHARRDTIPPFSSPTAGADLPAGYAARTSAGPTRPRSPISGPWT